MNFNIYNSLILAGIIQGLIFISIVLFSKKYKNSTTFILVALIASCVYNNLQYFLLDTGFLSLKQMFASVYLPIASLSPVLIYYYTLKFLNPSKLISKRNKLLLSFFIFFTISIIPYKVAIAIKYNNDNFFQLYGIYSNFHEFFSIILTIILVILSFSMIKKYEKINGDYSHKEVTLQLNWLKTTLILFFILSILWLILMVKSITISRQGQSFYLLWIGISFLTYWLGYIGIYKYGISEERKKIRIYNNKNSIENSLKINKNEHVKKLEKLLIEKKQFLNPTITLEEIAKKLHLSKSHLSRIIHSELNTSFTDYLNSLRVEQAKSYIENEKFSNYTFTAIGLESGFNSKSTFYKAFKRSTNFTPLEYKRNMSNFNS